MVIIIHKYKGNDFSAIVLTYISMTNKAVEEIGLIGLGDMGLMYAKRIVKAGWKYISV